MNLDGRYEIIPYRGGVKIKEERPGISWHWHMLDTRFPWQSVIKCRPPNRVHNKEESRG